MVWFTCKKISPGRERIATGAGAIPPQATMLGKAFKSDQLLISYQFLNWMEVNKQEAECCIWHMQGVLNFILTSLKPEKITGFE